MNNLTQTTKETPSSGIEQFIDTFRKDFGFSAIDIAPLLTPVENYIFKSRQYYSMQFSDTAFLLQAKTEPNKNFLYPEEGFECSDTNNYTCWRPAKFLTDENFMGQLLGPHLPVVMEIMYHSILRAKPMDYKRFEQLDLYKKHLESIMGIFPYDIDDTKRIHSMGEYIPGQNKTMIYFPVFSTEDPIRWNEETSLSTLTAADITEKD